MATDSGNLREWHNIESRLSTILPKVYQGREGDVLPVSMGSAGLKYGNDGKVAWNEIWQSFCDLAMAGGPPHRGTLLEPASADEIEADAETYREVVGELCRGIHLVTGLYAEQSSRAGWVRMYCTSAAMASWLARAIVMENVSADFRGLELYLPAGPRYRVEKEIKNVVTTIAKTCHYWLGHTSPEQHETIAGLLAGMDSESPLVTPAFDQGDSVESQLVLTQTMAVAIDESTGLASSQHRYAGWVGAECGEIRAAVWMMRVLAVINLFVRREGTAVFVPVNPVGDPGGERVVRAVRQAHGFAVERAIFAQNTSR